MYFRPHNEMPVHQCFGRLHVISGLGLAGKMIRCFSRKIIHKKVCWCYVNEELSYLK